jgi:mannose/cellobiose epimerase-like protein (N-acyl-D-glucosamine 2-epimerase family)
MAMAEYALATGSEEAGRLARQHYAILDRHMWDRTADNIVQARYRDWSPLPPGARDYRDQVSGTRTHHTRIHFMSAVSTYHEPDPSPEVSVRLARLVQLTERGLMTTPCSYFRERDGSRQTNQRFGHDIEAIHMLLQARARLGRCGSPPSFYGRVVDDALRLAEDRGNGGIMLGWPVGWPATNPAKDDWVQGDSLLTLAELYRHSRRPDRAEALFRLVTWIGRWQVDWANGSWFSRINASAMPEGDKAGASGGPFHTVRGTLGALRILEAIDGGLPKGGCTFL